MFEEKMKELRDAISEKETRREELADSMRGLLEENKTDEAKKQKEERDALKSEVEELRSQLATYEDAKEPKTEVKERGKEMPKDKEYRQALNDFIHSKGETRDGLKFKDNEVVVPAELLKRDGIVKEDVKPTIPEAVSYNPKDEIKTVVDLKRFANVFNATTASGKYPILKKATARLATVAELAKNPELAKPEFEEVDWAVQTYRGAIPISNESIQDSAVDLVPLIARNANEQKLNTTNYAIAEVLKGFTAKTVAGLDDIKAIINVDLDPAYNKAIVASQSMYQALDVLKDGNGRYLLQDSITSASGKVLLGMPVFVVGDDVLGAAGEAHMFIGDLYRAVLFPDRVDVTVRWVDDSIYGQYLQAATRFDAKTADKNAGYFVTFEAPAGE